ncbi:NAD(P)H-binding protein [Breoghania sp.]|uniref:NmrA family NAD(P)-binding protein n=1 Tax=Breoghania sp. TaxID=2065378 RepID=UPI0029C9FF3A|nr:NAD(P)H-binding protein [Breoghania sp.]
MHIILGGTGQVGGAAAHHLLSRGQAVTVVTRDQASAKALTAAGAQLAVVDIRDVGALHDILAAGQRALILNPPANPAGDFDAEEHANISAILAALKGVPLEKLVVISTYGARSGSGCGDLTSLYALEQGVKAGAVPAAINRGAFYMSNWLAGAEQARKTGVLLSFWPADMPLAMAAPQDLGQAAAERLMSPAEDCELRHVEGPRLYSPREVADTLGQMWGRRIELEVVPAAQREARYLEMGFSPSAARSFANMAEVVADGGLEAPKDPLRGATGLEAYLRARLG